VQKTVTPGSLSDQTTSRFEAFAMYSFFEIANRSIES
jgi:hypothetical protein